MARPSKTAAIDYGAFHDLTNGLLERATCPAGVPFVLVRDVAKKGLRLRVTSTNRKDSKGNAVYGKHWQYETRVKGKLFTRALGEWPAVSIAAAQAEAHRLRGMTEQGIDPRNIEALEKAAKAQAEAEQERTAAFTLAALALDYSAQLERRGRTSHAKVRALLKLHVIDAAPDLAGKAAALVTGEEVTDLMRKLNEDGKRRTAGKLRAYLRAAFEMARTAGMDADLPVRFKEYGIKHNPAAETKAIPKETDKNPLSGADLRKYWKTIKDPQTFEGAVLRLHLLTGGQRLEQLCRLRATDVKPGVLELLDGKGRPGKPRRLHPVPLTPLAAQALEQVRALAPTSRKSLTQTPEMEAGTFVISIDGGHTSLTANTLSRWAKSAGKGIDGFAAKRVRSGVETALASMRVSREDRGHLLSHGVGGVQSASYDGHDYMDVKLKALEALHRFLETEKAEIIPVAFGKVA